MSAETVANHPGTSRGATLALAAIRLGAAWVLLGAALKLFLGTPADLPAIVRDLPLALGLTYRLAIAAELLVGGVALLAPRRGWPLLVALLLAFDVALATQIAAGERSCGCFGSQVVVAPWVVLLVDTLLLVAVLATRPWRTLADRRGPAAVVVVALLAVTLPLPWILDREGQSGTPYGGRGYVDLDVEAWVGTRVDVLPTAARMQPRTVPDDGLWILYRDSCEDCAALFQWLTAAERGERPLVVVRLPEVKGAGDPRKVHVLPEGDFVLHAELPDDVDWLLPTPGLLVVRDRCVLWAKEAATIDDYEASRTATFPDACR